MTERLARQLGGLGFFMGVVLCVALENSLWLFVSMAALLGSALAVDPKEKK